MSHGIGVIPSGIQKGLSVRTGSRRCSPQVYSLLGLRRGSLRWFTQRDLHTTDTSHSRERGIQGHGHRKQLLWLMEEERRLSNSSCCTLGTLFTSTCWVWGDIALNPGASAQSLKLGRCCAVNLSLCGWQPGVNDWDTGSRNRSVRCLAPMGSHVLAEDGTGINKQPIPAHRRNRSRSPKQQQERLEVVCVTSYRGRWSKPLSSLKLSSCVRSQTTG